MQRVCRLFLILFSVVLGTASAQEVSETSGISVELASLTRAESMTRLASVKVQTERGYGSGVVIQMGKEKVVFTAHHVIENTSRIVVSSSESFSSASVLYTDEENDFAVLKIESSDGFKSVRFRPRVDSQSNTIGTRVHYSGHPAGHSLLTIRGSIAGIDRGCYIAQSYAWMGASGSGVFSSSGKLVGILTAIDFSRGGVVPQLVESIVWIVPVSNIDMQEVEKAIQEKL